MTSADYTDALGAILAEAQHAGMKHIDIGSHQLQLGAPGQASRDDGIPVCRYAMRSAMRQGDRVLNDNPAERRDTLSIRYLLPRSLFERTKPAAGRRWRK